MGMAALVALAAASLVPARAGAGMVMNVTAKGAQATAQFNAHEPIPCNGGTAILQTFISVGSFETQIRDHGTLVTQLDTFVNIAQTNFCTGETLFDFGFVQGGSLPMNGLQTGTIAGQYPLFISGGVLALNLTLTGSGNTSQGVTHDRSNIGPVMFLQKTTSQSTDATVTGTASLNGQPIALVGLTEEAATLRRNTGGQILVIGARS
jgi:hypothetical protein